MDILVLAPLVKVTIESWDKGANAFAIVVSDDSRLAISSRLRRGYEHYSRPANEVLTGGNKGG